MCVDERLSNDGIVENSSALRSRVFESSPDRHMFMQVGSRLMRDVASCSVSRAAQSDANGGSQTSLRRRSRVVGI
ncbi:hypothetical protein [Sphingobium sp. D43FB]|uniref:hypothetical protein n=1 Tax=Sphingobium sp. D43FB TaxID=2017595 RepID=UPI000BDD61C1|nr:hypothetical protein [Sphingobium sp. D43FB]PBN41771.1 hypothetical protein SxD43FB_19840 [Sphingobium sp. D43FB]